MIWLDTCSNSLKRPAFDARNVSMNEPWTVSLSNDVVRLCRSLNTPKLPGVISAPGVTDTSSRFGYASVNW